MSSNSIFFQTYDEYLTQYPTINYNRMRAFEFTRKAIWKMDEALSSLEFEEYDAECIYRYLIETVASVPFCAYLKRYLYERAALEGPFEEVSDSEYQAIIKEAFLENHTPFSWQETSRKPSGIIKRWLCRDRVLRQTVFLLGFGLRMDEKDVSEFLTKGIGDTDFNLYDVQEVLLWHCFHCGKSFAEYLSLEAHSKQATDTVNMKSDYWEIVVQNPSVYLFDEDKVLEYVRYLDQKSADYHTDVWKEFYALYETAGALCKDTKGDLPSRIERTFCSGIPRDERGNLQKITDSTLGKVFSLQKMSRQRIDAILKGKQRVDRFDIITLLFFIYSTKDMVPDQRRNAFIYEANSVLLRCHMMCLHFSNPYEAFVIMCLMTDQPQETYADVWELSYKNEEQIQKI